MRKTTIAVAALLCALVSEARGQQSTAPDPAPFRTALQLAKSAKLLRCSFDTSFVSVVNSGSWSSSRTANDRESGFTLSIDSIGRATIRFDQTGVATEMIAKPHAVGLELSRIPTLGSDFNGIPIVSETQYVLFGFPHPQNPKRLPLIALEFGYVGVSTIYSTKREGSCIVL